MCRYIKKYNDEANPELSQVIGRGIPYGNDYDYVFPCVKPNAIVL